MSRRNTYFSILIMVLCIGCTSIDKKGSNIMERNIAEGTNSKFSHSITTEASTDDIWTLWTEPDTWGQWDGGLVSASMDGPFQLGAKGKILSISGPESTFIVTELVPLQRYTFVTKLPLSKLVVNRFIVPSSTGTTTFTHEITFSGPLGWLFAQIYGPGFREELPKTMKKLAQLAEVRSLAIDDNAKSK